MGQIVQISYTSSNNVLINRLNLEYSYPAPYFHVNLQKRIFVPYSKIRSGTGTNEKTYPIFDRIIDPFYYGQSRGIFLVDRS